jgi:hypothetical protein
LAERGEVPARHRSRLGTEALMRDPVLELEWEEAVLAPGQDDREYGWPAGEWARLLEGDVGLVALVLGATGGHLGRHVVQEVVLEIDVVW